MTELVQLARYWVGAGSAYHDPGHFLYQNNLDVPVRITLEAEKPEQEEPNVIAPGEAEDDD